MPTDKPQQPPPIPADWVQISSNRPRDNFTFWAPSDTNEQKGLPGIDELILAWWSADLRMSILCCGFYTSPVEPPKASHEEVHQKVNGRDAILFIYEDKRNHPEFPYVVDLYIPNVGGKVHFRAVRFNMTVWCRSRAGIGPARQIISSLKFIRMSFAR